MTHLPAMVPEIQVRIISKSLVKQIRLIISIPWEQLPTLESSSTVVFPHARSLSHSVTLVQWYCNATHTHWCRCLNHLCLSSQAMSLSLKKQLQEWQQSLIFVRETGWKANKSQSELHKYRKDRKSVSFEKPNKRNPTIEVLQLSRRCSFVRNPHYYTPTLRLFPYSENW